MEASPLGLVHVTIAAFRGANFALYPLALSHAADHLSEEADMIEISRELLLSNGVGLALGPMLAGPLLDLAGRNGIFLFTMMTASITAISAFGG